MKRGYVHILYIHIAPFHSQPSICKSVFNNAAKTGGGAEVSSNQIPMIYIRLVTLELWSCLEEKILFYYRTNAVYLTLKAPKNRSRRHFNFLLLSSEENKAWLFFRVNPLPSRGFT